MKKLLLALFCLGLGFNASAQSARKPAESKPRVHVGDANPPTRAMSDADIDAQLPLIKVQSEQIKELTRRVTDLEARLNQLTQMQPAFRPRLHPKTGRSESPVAQWPA